MEELRSHRRSPKSSFGHVYSAPFPAKSDDYGEIFDKVATSGSIPFLDLPSSVESSEIGGLIGYSEIFGGFNVGDFAVDYEKLLNRGVERLDSSSGRVHMDAKFGKKEEASGLSPEGASCNDYGASSENTISSISNHSDDGSNQFSMLYQGTNCVSLEDTVGGKTHFAQLHAISGYAYTIKSCSLKDLSSDNSSTIQTSDLIYNITTNGRSDAVEQEKIASSSYSTENTQSYRDAMKANETEEYSNKHAASEDASVNVKHSSHSSTSHSASSGDVPYPDVPCVSISDINLQTKQSRVAPPSKTPPKIVRKQENTKMKMPRSTSGDQEGILLKPPRNHRIRYKIGAPKRCGLQSSDFPDGEVDTDSTAAASVAAMKEAMDQAQASLKSAKELMKRQRDNNERRKKLGHTYGTRYDEKEDAKAFEEEKIFREGTANKTLLMEDKQMKDYAIDDLQKVTEVGKTPPDHEESQTDAVAAAGSLQMRQGNGFKSSQMCSKSELCGEWKIEEKFYELVNNEKKFRAVKEGKQEDAEKKLKTTTTVNEVKESYSEEVELAYEFNRMVRLHKVNTPVERDEIGDNSNACNMTSKEEIRKTPEKTQDSCTFQDSLSSDYRDINQKLLAADEALVSGEELKKSITGKKASFGETEMNVQSCNNTFKIEEAYHDDEEHKKLHAANEPCKHDENDKESKGTYMTSISYESEEKLEMFRRTGVECVHENEMDVTSATCIGEADGELVAPEETYQFENYEYTRGNNRHEFYNEENECKLETTSFVSEHGGSRNLYRAQGKFISVENDLKSKAAQNGNEVKENSEELKPLREANNKKQNANCGTSVAEDNVKTDVLRSDHTESENGKFKDSIGAVGSEVTLNQFDAAQDRAENKDIGGVQQGSRAENEDLRDAAQEACPKSRSSHGAVGIPGTVVTENSNPDVDNKEDLEGDISIEREYEKEQARKAKEEKERERDKDRLAVERAREAHERALSEAWERTERIAVERATAEARQRALTGARGKAQKTSAEVLEKSLLEKALKEAKLRAERAAVERATAEARERAVEKAIAEKAAADARRRAERLKTVSRDESRKDNEAGSGMGDSGIKLKASSSDVLHDAWFQSAGSSSSSQIYVDSTAYGEDESPLRCKARSERHQRTVERAAKALAEKNLRDVLAQREQAERNRLAELLDADVRRWSAGKEGNLRALLSTLQYILGPESGWQSIPLTDVITAAAVKKAYRKATLFVHPDKLQQRGANIQQKYICEKVFDLLKEAWNKFNSEEP